MKSSDRAVGEGGFGFAVGISAALKFEATRQPLAAVRYALLRRIAGRAEYGDHSDFAVYVHRSPYGNLCNRRLITASYLACDYSLGLF